jgi:hypothetical protein
LRPLRFLVPVFSPLAEPIALAQLRAEKNEPLDDLGAAVDEGLFWRSRSDRGRMAWGWGRW